MSAHDGRWHYSSHFFPHVEGSLFIDTPTDSEPCTIKLTPAASADQAWLDEKGELIARAVNRQLDRAMPIGKLVEMKRAARERCEQEASQLTNEQLARRMLAIRKDGDRIELEALMVIAAARLVIGGSH